MKKNTLFVVGTGIKVISHLTLETKTCIEKADRVLYLVNEPAMQSWIQACNPSSESLNQLYYKLTARNENYLAIAKYVANTLQVTKTLCFVVYGHPTILVQPSIYAINATIKNNHHVHVLPSISTTDCLFSDLKIDPGTAGWQSFETTDFLIYRRQFDTSSHLILWQPAAIGLLSQIKNHNPKKGLNLLTQYLKKKYHETHRIIIYEAAQYPAFRSNIKNIALKDLPTTNIPQLSTLYVPPLKTKLPCPHMTKKINNLFSIS